MVNIIPYCRHWNQPASLSETPLPQHLSILSLLSVKITNKVLKANEKVRLLLEVNIINPRELLICNTGYIAILYKDRTPFVVVGSYYRKKKIQWYVVWSMRKTDQINQVPPPHTHTHTWYSYIFFCPLTILFCYGIKEGIQSHGWRGIIMVSKLFKAKKLRAKITLSRT